MFEWQQEYSVGVPALDRQHQHLFRLAGELHVAMTTGKGQAVLGNALERLIQYTKVHFAHEEGMMKEAGYPDYEAHCAQHEALTRQVVEFARRYESGKSAVTVQLFQFLKSWLVDHISGTDKKYGPYLNSRAA